MEFINNNVNTQAEIDSIYAKLNPQDTSEINDLMKCLFVKC